MATLLFVSVERSIQKLGSEALRLCNLGAGTPCCRLRKTDNFARTVSKTDVLGLLAAKTASGRASWRPRQPPDGPPGAQDGLQTGFLERKTASDGPPGAPDGFRMGLLAPQTASRRASWRPSRPLDGRPDAPDGLRGAIPCR